MKHAVFGAVCGAIIILTVIAILVIIQRDVRENEVNDGLSNCVDSVMESMMLSDTYSIYDSNEFVAVFCESMIEKINAGKEENYDKNLSVKVDITGIDIEKGLLGLHITETFTHPNGNLGTYECDRTALLETNKDRDVYNITFYVDGEEYYAYSSEEGSEFKMPPKDPQKEEKFLGWMDISNNEEASFPEKVTEDKKYQAVFEEIKEAV